MMEKWNDVCLLGGKSASLQHNRKMQNVNFLNVKVTNDYENEEVFSTNVLLYPLLIIASCSG